MAEPEITNQWAVDNQALFSDMLDNTLYNLMKERGLSAQFQTERDEWKKCQKGSSPDEVIANLNTRITALQAIPSKIIPQPGTPEYKEAAAFALQEACDRFAKAYREQGMEESTIDTVVKAMRNKLATTLQVSTSASVDEKKMVLAKTMQDYADKIQI